MTTLDDIIGLYIVGYRYGKAPECGRSFNTRENCYEDGVSMAQVGYCKEFGSFAADACADEGKYYYIGKIAGTGGDDEICLTDVALISKQEYNAMLPTMIETSNKVVDFYADRKLRLMAMGFNVCMTEQQVEEFRNAYKK